MTKTGTGVTTYTLHPGAIKTDLQRHVDMKWYMKLTKCCCSCLWKSVADGAATTIYCAVTPGLEKDSGKYFECVY